MVEILISAELYKWTLPKETAEEISEVISRAGKYSTKKLSRVHKNCIRNFQKELMKKFSKDPQKTCRKKTEELLKKFPKKFSEALTK